jgi:hypothetical protein
MTDTKGYCCILNRDRCANQLCRMESTPVWIDECFIGQPDIWRAGWHNECMFDCLLIGVGGGGHLWLRRRQIKEWAEMIKVVSFWNPAAVNPPSRVQVSLCDGSQFIRARESSTDWTINQCTFYYARLQRPLYFNTSWSEDLSGVYKEREGPQRPMSPLDCSSPLVFGFT